MTSKFIIIKRYNHIALGNNWYDYPGLTEWLNNPNNGKFEIQGLTNIIYGNEKDLTAFLLRWG